MRHWYLSLRMRDVLYAGWSFISISFLYIFRATMCPSSGEITVSMRHWYLSLRMSDVLSAGWSFIFISLLYVFRATMCPSSGEITVSMRHWYLTLFMGGIWSACWSFTRPGWMTPPIKSDKYQWRIDTVMFPDDGHMVARNM
jgi:hypothetical protein